MKTKLSLLVFLFLPSLVSATFVTCPTNVKWVLAWSQGPYDNSGHYYDTIYSRPTPSTTDWCTIYDAYPYVRHEYTAGTTFNGSTYGSVSSCPVGTSPDSNNFCVPPCSGGGSFNPITNSCQIAPLSAYNNNPDGCKTAGGVYFADKVCRSTADAFAKIASSPQFVAGGFLALNGFVWGSAGLLTGNPLAIAYGGHALAIGVGNMTYSALGQLISSSDTASAPSSDISTADGRLKVTLLPDSQALTKSDPSTGKVDRVVIIPNSVVDDIIQKQRYLMGGDLYQPNVTAPSPSLKDVKETSYDYVNNTATTFTHSPTSTPENPVTTSQTTPISVIQNPDGTVTTLPTNTTIAPTVSGSGGGTIVSPSTSGTGGTGSGTGTTSGTGLDYSGVLNDIRTNTSFMRDSLNPTLNQNHGPAAEIKFDSYSDIVKGSFNGFLFTDPLGLNALGGGGIQSYGFDLYGRHFVILDQSMIDQLPLEMMRNLFLFIAALLGLITVVSGV